MRLTAQDLRELNILKYYRLTRKWVCKTYGLKDADLELLIYLDCKCSQMISRIYRILLGEEDLPTSERSVFYKNKSYTDKVYNKAIDDMIKDKDR
jgi:hypothetical protein